MTKNGQMPYIQLVEMSSIVGPSAAYSFVEDQGKIERSIGEAQQRRYWYLPFRLLRRCRSDALPFIQDRGLDLFSGRPDLSSVVIKDEAAALQLISRRPLGDDMLTDESTANGFLQNRSFRNSENEIEAEVEVNDHGDRFNSNEYDSEYESEDEADIEL
jgi:hypothetical protein